MPDDKDLFDLDTGEPTLRLEIKEHLSEMAALQNEAAALRSLAVNKGWQEIVKPFMETAIATAKERLVYAETAKEVARLQVLCIIYGELLSFIHGKVLETESLPGPDEGQPEDHVNERENSD
jgi:hypothetical protein